MYFRRRKYQPVLLKTALAAHHLPGLEERNDVRAELAETQAIIDRNLEFAQIRAALCRLPPIYQEALVLKFLEEKTISEISGILGKNCNTVKSLIFRGLSCLRGFLPPPAFPDPGFPRKRTSMEVANHEREIEKPQI